MKSQGGRGRVLRFAVTGALLGGAASGCTGARDQPRTNTAHEPDPNHMNVAKEAEPEPEPDHVNVAKEAEPEPPPDAQPSPDQPPRVMVNPAREPEPVEPDNVNVAKEPDPPPEKSPEPKHVNVRKEPDPKPQPKVNPGPAPKLP